jgi:hypothetical protein
MRFADADGLHREQSLNNIDILLALCENETLPLPARQVQAWRSHQMVNFKGRAPSPRRFSAAYAALQRDVPELKSEGNMQANSFFSDY